MSRVAVNLRDVAHLLARDPPPEEFSGIAWLDRPVVDTDHMRAGFYSARRFDLLGPEGLARALDHQQAPSAVSVADVVEVQSASTVAPPWHQRAVALGIPASPSAFTPLPTFLAAVESADRRVPAQAIVHICYPRPTGDLVVNTSSACGPAEATRSSSRRTHPDVVFTVPQEGLPSGAGVAVIVLTGLDDFELDDLARCLVANAGSWGWSATHLRAARDPAFPATPDHEELLVRSDVLAAAVGIHDVDAIALLRRRGYDASLSEDGVRVQPPAFRAYLCDAYAVVGDLAEEVGWAQLCPADAPPSWRPGKQSPDASNGRVEDLRANLVSAGFEECWTPAISLAPQREGRTEDRLDGKGLPRDHRVVQVRGGGELRRWLVPGVAGWVRELVTPRGRGTAKAFDLGAAFSWSGQRLRQYLQVGIVWSGPDASAPALHGQLTAAGLGLAGSQQRIGTADWVGVVGPLAPDMLGSAGLTGAFAELRLRRTVAL
jgi:hypothetical protein